LKSEGELEWWITDADGNEIKKQKLTVEKGLNYIEWNLMDENEKTVQAGSYTLTIAGKNFETEKEFEVKERRRRY
jgi:flagellar hook assembly protein FlgD